MRYERYSANIALAERLLAENKFINPHIGRINDIVSANLFVISMPKCATTSIQRGLEKLGHSVIHAHNDLSTFEAYPNGAILRREGIGLEQLIALRNARNHAPAYFFCGYREPVTWYLSIAGHFNLPLDQTLSNRFVANIEQTYPWGNYSLREAQRIVENSIGLTMLESEFDRERGYSVFSKGNAHAVLYRFDKIDAVEKYIRASIDDRFEMHRERKNERAEYLSFLDSFKLPTDVLATLYSTELHRYFYSDEESGFLIRRFSA
jgi:hypothetical protein